jgi:transmembrane sensor
MKGSDDRMTENDPVARRGRAKDEEASAPTMAVYDPTPEMREAAAAWLLRLREPPEGRLGIPSLFAEFEAWKAQDPAHEFAFLEVEAFFEDLAAPAAQAADRRRRAEGRRRLAPLRAFPPPWAMAAGLAAAVLLVASQRQALGDLTSDAATPAGRQETLALADGSRVRLNTRSAADDLSTAHDRRVRLRHGEAYFAVARDPARPFTIEAGVARVQVLGTHFNVRHAGDQVLVGVEEGRVAVWSEAHPEATVQLTAGQEAVVSAEGAQRQPGRAVVIAPWRQGRLIVFQTPVREVVGELNRYRAAPIVVLNPRLGSETVSGVFDVADTRRALTTLEGALGARIVRIPGGAVLIY